MRVRIATFNVENLFTRFDFSAFTDDRARRYLPPIVNFFGEFHDQDISKFEEFKNLFSAAMVSQDDDKRQHTALAIRDTNADIVCFQEIDSALALRKFRDLYIHRSTEKRYSNVILHEGNDRRGIDVASMSTGDWPVLSRSHSNMRISALGSPEEREALKLRYPKTKTLLSKSGTLIFKRDCLELEFRKNDITFTLFICHFKSMSGGRSATIDDRQVEAMGVRRIIENKFENPDEANWMVLGDLNDYRAYILVGKNENGDGRRDETIKQLDADAPSGVDPLLDDEFSVNLVSKLTSLDRWTHYYGANRHKTQIDYMLASPAMAQKMIGTPSIIRSGMPIRVPNSSDINRYPRIGWDRPKASDHCPIVAEFEF